MSCSFPSFPLQFQPPTPSVTWSPHASGQPKTLQSYHCLSGQSPWRHCLGLQKLRTSLVVSTCLKLPEKSWNIALIGVRIIITFFEIEIAWNHPPDNMFNRGKPNKHNDQANFGEWLVSDRMITLQQTLSKNIQILIHWNRRHQPKKETAAGGPRPSSTAGMLYFCTGVGML